MKKISKKEYNKRKKLSKEEYEKLNKERLASLFDGTKLTKSQQMVLIDSMNEIDKFEFSIIKEIYKLSYNTVKMKTGKEILDGEDYSDILAAALGTVLDCNNSLSDKMYFLLNSQQNYFVDMND